MIIDALFPHRCSPLDLVVAQAMVIPEEKEDEEKERGGEEGGEPGPWVQHGMTEEDYLKKVRAHFAPSPCHFRLSCALPLQFPSAASRH